MTNPATRDAPQIVKHWTESEPVRLAGHRVGRVYLAGPMTGLPELNFPAFNAEAAVLRSQGLTVINPAEHGIVEGAEWADYLRHDIAGLASCERIHLLHGWENSKGARLEVHIAQQLGMVITRQQCASQPSPELAGVSDEAIYAVWAQHCQTPGTTTRQLVCAFARAILALRPQAGGFQNALDIRTAHGWVLTGDRLPVLYTDEINGRQVMRDDVWLCTTEALRPQAVPMTDEQRQRVFAAAEHRTLAFDNVSWRDAIVDEVEAHHGITAPAGGEG